MIPKREDIEGLGEEQLDDDVEDGGSEYECIRCDASFTRTDQDVEDGQSTEYCDACIRLMDNAEKGSAGDDDDQEENE